jgi:hypothetical protein
MRLGTCCSLLFFTPNKSFNMFGIPAHWWGECLFASFLWIWYAMMNMFLGKHKLASSIAAWGYLLKHKTQASLCCAEEACVRENVRHGRRT